MSTQPKKKQKKEGVGAKPKHTKIHRKQAQEQAKKDSAKYANKKELMEGLKEGGKKRPDNARRYGSKGPAKTIDPKAKKDSKDAGREALKKKLREGSKKPSNPKKYGADRPAPAPKKTTKHKRTGTSTKQKEDKAKLEIYREYQKAKKDGASKMPDGFNMQRPAEKLGYIQKLGAGRMSPGKMGDMTAMKMMHGDAAAKYYDGAGMYMNGAPKYVGASKSYVGPMTPGHGGAPGHTHGNKTEGDVSFSIGSEGAKLTDKVTQTKSTGSSTSSGSKTKVVDKGDDVFYNNLISSKKNMADMKSQGIDPRDKKAVLDYGNKLHTSRQKSSSGGSTTTSTSSSTKSNPVTERSIQDEGRYEMKKIIGQDNLSRYAKEMQAVQDSTSMANKVFTGMLNLNPDRSPGTVGGMKEIAGRYGHEAANITRKKHNIPQTHYGRFGKDNQNIKMNTPYHEGYVGSNEKRFLKNPYAPKDDRGRQVSSYVANPRNERVVKQPYGRKQNIFTDIDEVFPKGGTPKMPKGPMKYGMKK